MKQILSLIFLILTCKATFAQRKEGPAKPSNPLDLKYSPPTNSVFSATELENVGPLGPIKTVIGLEPTQLPRGVFAFCAERQIAKSPLSINGGLGLVFSKDLMQYFFASPDVFDGYSNLRGSDFSLGEILKYSTFSPNHRFFGMLNLRMYNNYLGDLDGTYFEFGVRWHKYETKLTTVSADTSSFYTQVPAPIYTQIKGTTFSAKFGVQSYSGNGRFYNNFYIGLGIKKVEFDGIKSLTIDQYITGYGNKQHYDLIPKGTISTNLMPQVLIGWQCLFGL